MIQGLRSGVEKGMNFNKEFFFGGNAECELEIQRDRAR